jgi:hypothetical protein
LQRDYAPKIWQVAFILIFALLFRLIYQAGMLEYGGSFHNGSDSQKYLDAVNALLRDGIWLDPDRVPLYAMFIASIFKVVGSESLRAVVAFQACLDSFSVIAIAFAARTVCARAFLPAAFVAIFIPNFLVHSAYILQESFFLPFFSCGLWALLLALRRPHIAFWLAVGGLLFGITLWIRISLSYYPLFLVPAVAVGLRISHGMPWRRCVLLALLPPSLMLAVASPLLLHNYSTYGYFALSSQSGSHLLNWVYACLASNPPCAQRDRIVTDLTPLVTAYANSIGGERANPFAVSDFMRTLAVTRILELPLPQIIWGISYGALKNLMQTGFYQVLVQFNQPLTFFSAMPGGSFAERLQAFVHTNKSNAFMLLWGVSQAGLVVSRAIQFFGVIVGLRLKAKRGQTILLIATVAYLLALNGPIADPKYRVPIEPALIILFALGWVRLVDIFRPASHFPQRA